MDSIIYLEHLSSLLYHLGFGFSVFGNFKEMSEIFGLFLLLAFGFKSLYYVWFPTSTKSRKPKNIKITEKSDLEFDGLEREEDCSKMGVRALRKVIKRERRRLKAAIAEVEREREACATAAEEAMAMIRRLQTEKSSMEMELNQYRRFAEAKSAHDEEVIQSLKWLLMRQEVDVLEIDDVPVN